MNHAQGIQKTRERGRDEDNALRPTLLPNGDSPPRRVAPTHNDADALIVDALRALRDIGGSSNKIQMMIKLPDSVSLRGAVHFIGVHCHMNPQIVKNGRRSWRLKR